MANPVILPIPLVDFPVITKDDAVAAFRNYVASKMCWEHSFTQNLLVLAVDLRFSFHPQDEMSYCYKITLDNYYESRSAMWQESRLSTAPLSPLGADPVPTPGSCPSPPPRPSPTGRNLCPFRTPTWFDRVLSAWVAPPLASHA